MRMRKGTAALTALLALVFSAMGCRVEKWIDAPNDGKLFYTFFADRSEAMRVTACLTQFGYFSTGGTYKLEDGGETSFTFATRIPRATKNGLRRNRARIVAQLIELRGCLGRESGLAFVTLRFVDTKSGKEFLVLRADRFDMKECFINPEPMD